jgi:hypothetical protein
MGASAPYLRTPPPHTKWTDHRLAMACVNRSGTTSKDRHGDSGTGKISVKWKLRRRKGMRRWHAASAKRGCTCIGRRSQDSLELRPERNGSAFVSANAHFQCDVRRVEMKRHCSCPKERMRPPFALDVGRILSDRSAAETAIDFAPARASLPGRAATARPGAHSISIRLKGGCHGIRECRGCPPRAVEQG